MCTKHMVIAFVVEFETKKISRLSLHITNDCWTAHCIGTQARAVADRSFNGGYLSRTGVSSREPRPALDASCMDPNMLILTSRYPGWLELIRAEATRSSRGRCSHHLK